ncbi:hypothetical protein BMS3Bbin04_00502 [bacterium BMS3Bbin04]|nr:hypothetical protein BMS3Bbin04_00502 [bacterium BMS3Bbin04]
MVSRWFILGSDHLDARRPLIRTFDQGETDLLFLLVNIRPILVFKQINRSGEQYGLLLGDHVIDFAQNGGQSLVHVPHVAVIDERFHLFQFSTDLVMDSPHDFARTFKPFSLEFREEQIFLAQVMLLDGPYLLDVFRQ